MGKMSTGRGGGESGEVCGGPGACWRTFKGFFFMLVSTFGALSDYLKVLEPMGLNDSKRPHILKFTLFCRI